MSLVEQALKKVQQAQVRKPDIEPLPDSAIVAAGQPAIGTPTSTPVVRPRVPERTITIDRDALRRVGLLPPESQERHFAQEYRHIKRPLIERARGGGDVATANPRVVMVASAMPGDGKTCTSLNLALSIAREKDVSVLLVDADVAKPQITSLLGMGQERGLLDVLKDSSMDVDDMIVATDVRGLSFLPAGGQTEHATELLASGRMQQVLEHLLRSDPNRVVLFDSPPLLVTTESRVLASLSGQVVLVVCADRTPQKAVSDTLALLRDAKFIGIVLNQAAEQDATYGYGYGAYGQSSEADSAAV